MLEVMVPAQERIAQLNEALLANPAELALAGIERHIAYQQIVIQHAQYKADAAEQAYNPYDGLGERSPAVLAWDEARHDLERAHQHMNILLWHGNQIPASNTRTIDTFAADQRTFIRREILYLKATEQTE